MKPNDIIESDLTESVEAYGQIHQKIQALQTALLEKLPSMPTLLREIHREIKNDPAQVTLLSEDEIHIIVQGLERQTNTYIASSVTKTKTPGVKAQLKKMSSGDLGF